MAEIETPRFPDELAFWATGGPEFSTFVSIMANASESRNINWEDARCSFELAKAMRVLGSTHIPALTRFFRIAKGRANSFRFKDYQDYILALTEGVLSTSGATGGAGLGVPSYSIYKKYVEGSFIHYRRLLKIVAAGSGTAAHVLKRDAATVTLGGSSGQYSIDINTGTITFVADASNALTSHTPGATHQFVSSTDIGGLNTGHLVYLTGITGTAAATLNNLAHSITNRTGSGPYTYTLATNTTGLTVTGQGTAAKYPQSTEILTFSCQFDLKARFDIDKLAGGPSEDGTYVYNTIPILELLR